MRLIARTMSVDLSITISAAVPRPGAERPCSRRSPSARPRIIVGRDQRDRRTAGDHREQVVPPAADAAAMLLDQLVERDAHRFFDHAGLVRRGR